ncbi:MAG: NAD(+)/NADH kinase [Desulfurococcaceae archaeon]
MFQKILIIYKPVDKCIDKLHYIINILKERKVDIKVLSVDDVVKIDETPDLVIGIGGDGTILKISSAFQNKSPITLPIPCGRRMIFYERFDNGELANILNRVFNGDFRIESLRRINVEFSNKVYTVLNEALLLSTDRGRVTGFEVRIESISRTYNYGFDGDGVMVGGAPGSTAYNLTVGGSIVDPGVESIFITPLNPMDRSLTQITVPLISYVTLSSRGRTELYLDGEKVANVPPHQVVSIYPCHYKLRIIRIGRKNIIRDIYERRRFEIK